MGDRTLAEHLDFLVKYETEDEATVLARALGTGIEALYREALIEGYLSGGVPRETVLSEVGVDKLAEIDYQRDALRCDFEWGLQGA